MTPGERASGRPSMRDPQISTLRGPHIFTRMTAPLRCKRHRTRAGAQLHGFFTN